MYITVFGMYITTYQINTQKPQELDKHVSTYL